jgi:hypothetical protein
VQTWYRLQRLRASLYSEVEFWAGEICDPVEDDRYGYQIGGTLVSYFVTPNWFAHQDPQTLMDFKKHTNAPFAILSGGYAQKFDSTNGWQQITGAKAALTRRATAVPGSRRER